MTPTFILALYSAIFFNLTNPSYHEQHPVKLDRKELICLTEAIYFESRGESTKGKKAVADVVLNRVNHKNFPSSICSVVYQPHQFSWTRKKPKVKNNEAWKEALDIAHEKARKESEGKRSDVTNNSVFFRTGGYHKGTKRVVKIGSHYFSK